MSGLFLSRARLRRDAPLAALARLLVPDAAEARVAAAHHLIWALFADGSDRRRDFLWREERPGEFLTLSARPPDDPHGLFVIDPPKPFAPNLSPGDRLGFALRANPVVSRGHGAGGNSRRHDVVMDALRDVPKGPTRAEARPVQVIEAGRAWLARQGAVHGFRPSDAVGVDGYARLHIPRNGPGDSGRPGPGRRSGGAVFGVMDFQGVLTVEDPAAFMVALATGFGRARAFGCGLMLIRRAR